MLDRLAEKLDLSADEKAAVGDVLADHHKAVEAYRDEHRDEFVALRKKMRQAHKDGDRDELQALRKKMREMISGRMELAKSLHKQVLAALPEDKAAEAKAMFAKARKRHAAVRHRFMQRHPGLRMLAGLRKLDLSDEQREKIRDIVADAQEKIEDVLTDEQKEKLKQMRRRAAAERRGGRSRRDRPASDGKD
ncbi:MAG: hypothetical protein KGY99_09020 [Phycisphaerae bacterium]|nr:hypothetical protein [Phycisphaerae bacterium]